MKRWMLDAIVGIISLIVYLVILLILPAFMTGGAPYLIALLLFIAVISAGGYFIRNTAP